LANAIQIYIVLKLCEMWKHVQNSLPSYLLSKLDKQDTQNSNTACYIRVAFWYSR